MGKTTTIQAAGSRIAFFALLMVTMLAAVLHFGGNEAQAASAAVAWNAPTTNTDGTTISNLAGYNLYVGNASRSYQQKINVGTATSYNVANLNDGSTYYFAVTAYNSAGAESAYSTEASKAFPAATTTYTITATAYAGGSITPLNNTRVSSATSGTTAIKTVTVTKAASQAFTIAPSTGYKIADVKVNGVSVGAVASYTFSNVTANNTIAATFAAATTTVVTPKLVYAANAGGTQYTDASGVVYRADAYYTGGNAGTTGVAINNTTDDVLYQAERWGASTYNIPLTNGNYNLTLKFSENYWSAAGQRVFDVAVNGVTMISSLDIFAKAGKNTAYDVVLPVTVSNGTLNIRFINKIDNAKIAGFKIYTR